MSKERNTTVIRPNDIELLLKSGLTCRAFTALSLTDEPYMTLQEIADVCGFAPNSLICNGFLGNLFHAQMVESVRKEKSYRVRGYRLTQKARRSICGSNITGGKQK